MMIKKRILCSCIAGSVAFAFAGSGAIAASNEGYRALEEVVVTAQKREQSLQDTPIAITTLSGESLEKLGVTDLTDLRGLSPSLSIAPFAGDRASPIVFVRGMGTITVQTTQDSAVGLYVDGVPLGRATGLATEIAEIERVEVLRGPQGTLYGKNATAGAVNFVTRKPHDEFSFKTALGFGNYSAFSSRTVVNAPISDNLFIKAAYMKSQRDGWVRNHANLADQADYYEEDNKAGQFALRYLPSDTLTIDYSYDQSSMEYGNSYYQITHGITVDRADGVAQDFGLEPSKSEISGHTLTIEKNLTDTLLLRSITSYRDVETDVYQNYIGAFYQNSVVDQFQYSQEFQLVGDYSDSIQYVAGVFYYLEESEERGISYFGFTPYVDDWYVEGKAESIAAFGQVTWTPDILDKRMDITLGARYTKDSREADKWFLGDLFTGPLANPIELSGDRSDSKFNPSVTVNYTFSDALNGYAKIATGYRAGGFNTRSTVAGFAAGFAPEEVISYEAGIKSQFNNNRTRLNAAVYYNDYEDLQVSQFRPGIVFTDILNAGKAVTQGVELELSSLITDRLAVDLFYSYIDAEFKEYVDSGVDHASEYSVPYAPKDTARLGLEYEVGDFGHGTYTVSVDYQYQSKTFSGPRPMDYNDSYGILNGRISLSDIPFGNKGTLRVGLWAKNILDKEYTVLTSNLGSIASVYGTPRTYGLDIIFEM